MSKSSSLCVRKPILFIRPEKNNQETTLRCWGVAGDFSDPLRLSTAQTGASAVCAWGQRVNVQFEITLTVICFQPSQELCLVSPVAQQILFLPPPSLGHICYYFFAIACGAPVFPYIKSHINLGGNFSGSFQPPPHTPPPLINTVSGHPSLEQLGIEEVHLVGQYV